MSSPAAAVTIYTQQGCSHCEAAKTLLRARGLAFKEIDLTNDAQGRSILASRTAFTTLRQVFVGERFVGGSVRLRGPDTAGELIAAPASSDRSRSLIASARHVPIECHAASPCPQLSIGH